MSAANKRQVAGEHYMKHGDFQPWDAWWHWKLNPFQAVILKHVVRYRDKLGIQDLEKAKHYLEKLIELERRVQHTHTLSPGLEHVQCCDHGVSLDIDCEECTRWGSIIK